MKRVIGTPMIQDAVLEKRKLKEIAERVRRARLFRAG